MKIHEVIREKRIGRGLTQEQLAQRLGVSTPAVNKWERAVSYPDITLLPVLARTLGVDLNTLLCFQEDLSREEVARFVNDLAEEAKELGAESAFRSARKKLREYPTNDFLALSTAHVLDGALTLWPEGDQAAQREEVMGLYRRCAESQDTGIAVRAQRVLVSRYTVQGKLSQAEEWLEGLPVDDRDRPMLEAQLRRKQGREAEAWPILEQQLFRQATDLYSTLMILMGLALDMGEIEVAEQFCDTVSRMGEVMDLWPYLAESATFQAAVVKQNQTEALSALERMLQSLTEPWILDDSPLYRHLPGKEKAGDAQAMMIQPLLDEMEKDPACEFLRRMPECRTLIERFRKQTQR